MKKLVFNHKPIIAIDIGTTKICVLVAQPLGGDTFELIGIGKSPSHGLEKGVVVDVAQTVQSVKNAIREAELMAGCKIEQATIGISGAHIQSRSSHGMVAINRHEIRQHDIAQAINAARAITIPEGQQILHVLPQYFVIDSHEKVTDPLGMYGVRLEAHVHIITGSIASVCNLVKCCESAGIHVSDIVLEQLASGDAVLSQDEKMIGVGMLDIGGGTSDLAVYHRGTIAHTMVVPVAGNHFTKDLAIGLRTTIKSAEETKKEYGIVDESLLIEDACIEIATVDGNNTQLILQSELVTILHARARELLTIVHKECLTRSLYAIMPSGFVLTGGGSLLKGMARLGTNIFKTPVRVGNPQTSSTFSPFLHNPMYATGYGLLLHAFKKQDTTSITKLNEPLSMRIMSLMKSWVSDFF